MQKPLTTVQMARALKVGRATLYRWLKDGKIRPSIEPKIRRVGKELVLQPMGWTEKDVEWIRQWMKEHYRFDKAEGGRK